MARRIGIGIVVLALGACVAEAQFVQQGGKLVGSGATDPAWQGGAVAVSSDGNTAIVGGYLDNQSAGGAWIFGRTAGVWSQQGTKLVGTSPTGSAAQGYAVAISGDGNTAIVGGPGDNKGVGAVWVFVRSGGTWIQQGNKLSGGGASGHASFGWSVALSADGDEAIVGGPGDNNNIGAAWVFTRTADAWRQQGNKLVGTGAVGAAWQGWSVSLSADGSTAAVGGLHDNQDTGAVWVFAKSASTWAQQGNKLVGASPATTFTISDNATVNANFSQQPSCFTFSANSQPGNGGTLTVNTAQTCTGGYLDGTQISLQATPSSGWTFVGWSATGGTLSSPTLQTTSFTISGNAKVTATFSNQQSCYFITVTSSPANGGNIVVNTTQNCGTSYLVGTAISLTADPVSGWVFAGWSATSGTFSDAGALTTVYTITTNAAITATFTQSPGCFPLTTAANPSAGGTVAVGTASNCTGGYLQGTHVVLTASAAAGYRFTGWTASGGTFTSATSPVTALVVSGAATATANFAAGPPPCYTLAAAPSPGDGGSVSVNTAPNCSGGYLGGTQIALGAIPGAGWTFVGWSGAGGTFSNTSGVGAKALEGEAIALSGDGSTMLIGGYLTSTSTRAVWVFTRASGSWSQQGPSLAPSGLAGGASQAWAVSASTDGNTAVIAEPGDGLGAGAAWVFTRSGSAWAQLGAKLVGVGASGAAGQGASVALSGDAGTILLGGPGDASGAGATWAFAEGANPACTFNLTPSSQGVAARGGTGSVGVAVAAGSGCSWVAWSNAPWLTITSGTAGTDAGVVKFAANGNPGNARSGTITVAGEAFTVYQAGDDCAYQLSAPSEAFPSAGGGDSFTVTSAMNCPWTATTTTPWLHVTSGAAGVGDGTVAFTVDANTGASRSGTIAVQDQTFTVTQANGLPPVEAAFTFAPAAPIVGEVVHFADASTGAPTSWSWDFGDGAASTVQNPTHAFATAGTFTVTLTAVNVNAPSAVSHQVTVGEGASVWLPVASHTEGIAGSVWLSDVGVLNVGAASANVQFRLFTPAGVVSMAQDVAAGSQAILADLVGQLGFVGSGAVELRSDQPVIATSRTYNKSANGTFGQDYAASAAADALAAGDSALLPQLTENAAFRTNISLTDVGSAPATVTVTLLDGDGAVLASYDVSLAPGEWKQANRPFFVAGKQTALDRGYAIVAVTAGDAVVASASVIDNVTNDPTTIAAVRTTAPVAGSSWIPVASHSLGARGSAWLSDLGVLVPGGAAAHVEVRLHTSGGALSLAADVAAASQAVFADVVGQLGFVGSGAIEVVADQPAVVTSRTYNRSA
ncbi:MAG TPA: PKD domain-containing protein, partial [Thermoanaerobaculaceae bacterium]|nr:PKD domain-containing protein [Thermoanaerobaculaceae bacterium]